MVNCAAIRREVQYVGGGEKTVFGNGINRVRVNRTNVVYCPVSGKKNTHFFTRVEGRGHYFFYLSSKTEAFRIGTANNIAGTTWYRPLIMRHTTHIYIYTSRRYKSNSPRSSIYGNRFLF